MNSEGTSKPQRTQMSTVKIQFNFIYWEWCQLLCGDFWVKLRNVLYLKALNIKWKTHSTWSGTVIKQWLLCISFHNHELLSAAQRLYYSGLRLTLIVWKTGWKALFLFSLWHVEVQLRRRVISVASQFVGYARGWSSVQRRKVLPHWTEKTNPLGNSCYDWVFLKEQDLWC